VAVVWSESRIVRQRAARQMQTEAVVMQTVIASAFAEKGKNPLGDLLKRIEDVG